MFGPQALQRIPRPDKCRVTATFSTLIGSTRQDRRREAQSEMFQRERERELL